MGIVGIAVGITVVAVLRWLTSLPLAWAVVVGLVAAFAIFFEGAYRASDRLTGFEPNATKTPVIGKLFANEAVVLDGNSFSSCTFRNVTLVFKGKAPFDLVNCTFSGFNLDFRQAPQADMALHILRGLDMLRGPNGAPLDLLGEDGWPEATLGKHPAPDAGTEST